MTDGASAENMATVGQRRSGTAFWPLVGYFPRVGTLGFGGPVALAGFMHRDLVERRGWISQDEYNLGLALAQIMPGPLLSSLANPPG